MRAEIPRFPSVQGTSSESLQSGEEKGIAGGERRAAAVFLRVFVFPAHLTQLRYFFSQPNRNYVSFGTEHVRRS